MPTPYISTADLISLCTAVEDALCMAILAGKHLTTLSDREALQLEHLRVLAQTAMDRVTDDPESDCGEAVAASSASHALKALRGRFKGVARAA